MSSRSTIRKLTFGPTWWWTAETNIICNDSEKWKAVRDFWDGSSKDVGKSGCELVIKAVNRDRWVTIIRIAVPLKVGTAMAAEVAGVCLVTGILDLVFSRCLCVQNIMQCINKISNKQWNRNAWIRILQGPYERPRKRAKPQIGVWSIRNTVQRVLWLRFSKKKMWISSGQVPARASCGNASWHGPQGRKLLVLGAHRSPAARDTKHVLVAESRDSDRDTRQCTCSHECHEVVSEERPDGSYDRKDLA